VSDQVTSDYDWPAFREAWTALVPCAGVSLLAAAGGSLSVLFRFRPPAHGSGPTLAVLYVVAIAILPVVLSVLFVGFDWARTALIVLLWTYIGLTLLSLPHLFEAKPRAGWVILLFTVPELVALHLVHGTRFRDAVALLAEKRNARWGPGFGWAILVSACGLFASSTVTVLLSEQLSKLAFADLTKLRGPFQLLPAVAGLLLYASAIARAPVSRVPLRSVLLFNLVPIGVALVSSDATSAARAMSITALMLNAAALFGSTLPSFKRFWANQRAKRESTAV
jgi:hypothetical protein